MADEVCNVRDRATPRSGEVGRNPKVIGSYCTSQRDTCGLVGVKFPVQIGSRLVVPKRRDVGYISRCLFSTHLSFWSLEVKFNFFVAGGCFGHHLK